MVPIAEATIVKAIAWREQRLVFEAMPLSAVIDEFNRYNEPPMIVNDPELELIPISGTFRANDRDSFQAFLSQMGLAEARTRTDGTVELIRLTTTR